MSTRIAVLTGLVVLVASSAAFADVLRVPEDFATIQAAVNDAGEGDVIQISKGTYQERVVISGKTDLVIQGRGRVELDGGSGAAITVSDSSQVTIERVSVTSNVSPALHLLRATDCVVQKCRIVDVPGRALLVGAGGGHTITRNRFDGNDGANIDLDSDATVNPTNCEITKNRIAGGFVGVEIQGTGHLVQKNKIAETEFAAIQSFQSADLQIERNSIKRVVGTGIRVRGPETRVIRNKIVICDGDGIYLHTGAASSRIERNTVKRTTDDALDTDDDPVDDVEIVRNKLIQPGDDGLDVHLTNSLVEHNKIVKADDDGIRVGETTTTTTFNRNKTAKSGNGGLNDFSEEGVGVTFTDNRFK